MIPRVADGAGNSHRATRVSLCVRALPAAILVSVAIHIAAVAWVVRAPAEPDEIDLAIVFAPAPPAEPAPAEPAPAEPPAAPEPPPIEIVFLEDRVPPPPARSEPLPSPTASDEAPSLTHRAISLIDPRTAPEPPAATSPTPAPADRSPLMSLRTPSAPSAPPVDLSVTQLFKDELFVHDFESRTKPLAPIPDLPGARLDAEIADIRARLRKPGRGGDVGDLSQLVSLNEARANVELRPDGGGRYKAKSPNFKAKIDPDGKVHIQDNPSFKVIPGILMLTVIFDATDLAMRAKGMDPYASEKLAFLDRTRDQRVAIGTEYRRAQLAQSAHHMRHNIATLWSATPDSAARKRALFELWDECAESGSDDLLRGAADARKALTDHIKAKLAGPLAYTPEELAQLNQRRRSKAAFAPYD